MKRSMILMLDAAADPVIGAVLLPSSPRVPRVPSASALPGQGILSVLFAVLAVENRAFSN